MALPTIQQIARALEGWAPAATAQSYDNVGLQVGDAQVEVGCGLVALDMTPAVLEEAEKLGAGLIVTHHPLLFKPLKRITTSGFVSSLAFELARRGIALYSIHTNLDAASDGVSFALAELLGLEDIRLLGHTSDAMRKLVTFLPSGLGPDAIAAVQSTASFVRLYDEPEAHEARLEVHLPHWQLGSTRAALRAILPDGYELHSHVLPLEGSAPDTGLGAIGQLPEPEPLPTFLNRIARRLDADALRYVGDDAQQIRRVAVCGGSGSSFIKQALAAGADAYLTADITYHTFFDVLDEKGMPRMALVDAGHYETEAHTETLLVDWLSREFPGVTWHRTQQRTGPMRTFAASS